ncbi:MAG: hypothetical protein U9N57_01395 [Pseudomonadota bacterium]|nr:hypothetical protein [Pseudomonadota bacterium]
MKTELKQANPPEKEESPYASKEDLTDSWYSGFFQERTLTTHAKPL